MVWPFAHRRAVLSAVVALAAVVCAVAAPTRKTAANNASKSGTSLSSKAATQVKQKSAASKAGTSKAGTKSTARSAGKRTPGTSPKTARRRSRATVRTVRVGQRQPTPERIKEIQSALVARGYLTEEPDGVWGDSTVDALKRFQRDQNLNADGKLSSHSLIALGLGPRRTASLATAPTVVAPTPPPESSKEPDP